MSQVEELIAKFQIADNPKNEIALSPMNEDLQKAKLTIMMDRGWDERASGKAYSIAVPQHVTSLSAVG
jgi:hypothetical protein